MRDYTGAQVEVVEEPKTRRILTQIDYYLRDLSKGIARIQKGEVPDGSGDPILPPDGPFLYKPGLSGGQIAYGGTIPGDDIEFHSGIVKDGLIKLGDVSALDESTARLGVGTLSPQAVLHLTQAAQTTSARPFNIGGGIGDWAGQDAGTTNLQNYVNELVPDDSTYVHETLSSGSNLLTLGLWTIGSPLSMSGVTAITIRFRLFRQVAVGGTPTTEQFRARLYSNAFLIADGAVATISQIVASATFVDLSYTLSSTELAVFLSHQPGSCDIDIATVAQSDNRVTYAVGWIQLDAVAGATTNLARWDSASVQTGRITVDGYVESRRFMLLGSSSGTLTHQGPAAITSHTLTWPAAQGAASTLLSNNGSGVLSWATLASLGFAPVGATYITQTADATLTNEQALGSLATGILKSTTTTGVLSIAVGADLPAHNFLSAQHGDTTVGTVARGDVITGQGASAKWVRLAKGTANQVLSMDGTATDVVWATVAAGGNTFLDNVFRVQDNGDPTKQLAFEVSGVTAATTRTLTVPDRSSTIATLDGSQVFTGPTITLPPGILSGGPKFQCDDVVSLSGNGGLFAVVHDIASGEDLSIEVAGAAFSLGVGVLSFPSAGGTVVTTDAAQTIQAKIFTTGGGANQTQLRCTSVSAGVCFADNTTNTKRLRMVLSGASANNHSFTIANTAARDYKFEDVPGSVEIVGNGANPPAAGAMGKLALTAQAAAIGATNLTNTTPAGFYRVSFYLETTTANVADGTIGFQVSYTDRVGATNQVTAGTLALAATTTGTTALKGEFYLYLASGNITYQTNLTGAQTTSRYSLDARCEFLG